MTSNHDEPAKDHYHESPSPGDLLRRLAETVDSLTPTRRITELCRLLTIITTNADPAVFADGDLADESGTLAAVLLSRLDMAEQLRRYN
jgi:hypothetical protein